MTVIRPNSISGVSSITGSGGDIKVFRADGTAADVTVNNITSGIITATSFSGSGANLTGINTAFGNSSINSTGIITAAQFHGDGSNLTSISGPNISGVIPSSSLSNVDLTGIRRDIALLSLQTAVDTNRVVYNLENSFIDQFEDSTGLSTTTNVSRDRLDEFLFAGTQTAQSTVSWSYDGSDDLYTPPTNVKFFIAHIWGAAGAAGYNYSPGGGGGRSANAGAPGGYTTGTVTVRADSNTGTPTYLMSVGQGGTASDVGNAYTSASFNGGGRGRVSTHYGVGGGGGGYSGIFLQSKTHGTAVMIAGGGAGAQSINSGGAPFYAGSGGGLTGQDGGQNSHSSHANISGGLGGTQTSGGAYGTGDYNQGSAGSALQGGDGGHMNGGGGGGYYGGGGGNHKNNYGSSGSGGGSGYIAHSSVSEASTQRTDNATATQTSAIDPPGTNITGYASNAGRGVSAANGNNGQIIIIPYVETTTTTGTAISKANTVTGARTKVSGVLLYKDAAGTNTLGTDLKVYFSCNGGTNFTELGASDFSVGSDFSTGVKTVYLAQKTCTSGTDVRYKIEFANQSGSKKAEVYGIALNY